VTRRFVAHKPSFFEVDLWAARSNAATKRGRRQLGNRFPGAWSAAFLPS